MPQQSVLSKVDNISSFLADTAGGRIPDMFGEIQSQTQVWPDAFERIPPQIEEIVNQEWFRLASSLDIVGIGSSENAAWIAALGISSARVCVQPSTSYHPVSDVMVAISQSGESTDTIEAVEYGKQRGIHVIGVTAAANSALYRLADATILLDVPRENAIAATVSMTTTVLALQMLLARFAGTEYESRQGIGDELQSLIASQSERGSALHSLRLLLEPAQYIAVLGDGPYVGVAREVALKIRETTGVIAEGMNAREYRHGPMEVLASPRLAATGVRRALILFESELVKAEAVLGFYGGLERKYRGTPYEFTLIRVGVGRAATGHDVVLPGVGAFNPNLAVVFCGQLVAYELALRHGIVPGTSEVLSKVVVGT